MIGLRRLAFGILCGLALLATSHPAHAQIVNVQPLLADGDADGFDGQVGGSLNLRTGNVDLLLGKASLLMSYRFGIHKLISSSKGELGLKGGDEFLEKVFTHMRHQARISDWFTWETYAQAATDRFKRVSIRALAGAGPRFALIEGPAVAFAVAISYLFERQVLGESDWVDSGLSEINHRVSMYITGRFRLDPLISLVHTSYYQPRLDDPLVDFRVHSESRLAFKLAERFSLAVSFDFSYDSGPPINVKSLDTGTSLSLGFAF